MPSINYSKVLQEIISANERVMCQYISLVFWAIKHGSYKTLVNDGRVNGKVS